MKREIDVIDVPEEDLIEVLTDKSAIIAHDVGEIERRPKAGGSPSNFYLMLPAIFLAVTLLGGLRFAAADNAFVFLKPPLLCLVLAAVLMVQFVRTGLIDLGAWFNEVNTSLANAANAGILLTIFAASTQAFNSLLPERGLPLWVVGFCFVWTLSTNLFSDLDPAKLLKSTGAMFALAFVAKYLVLANLTAPEGGSWLQRIIENPGKEAFSWLLDLPRYSAATGYMQFLALGLFLLGLFLTPARPRKS